MSKTDSPIWVKASERLPEGEKDFVIKCINLEDEPYYQIGSRGRIGNLLNHELDLQVEWLDESPKEDRGSDAEAAARKYATSKVKGPTEWNQFDGIKFNAFIAGAKWAKGSDGLK